ncbi:MAG: tetratricopeptide repeat protein, partial [Pseudomonadales bacterium]|nr:tetratricopeptide repeat protein [Pseudomonadales bacterium]
MRHAKLSYKNSGHLLLKIILASLTLLPSLRKHSQWLVARKPKAVVAGRRMIKPGATAVFAGLLVGLISTHSMALRNNYNEPSNAAPSILAPPEMQNEETAQNPEFAPLYYNRGNALYDKGEYLKAIQSYNNALFLEPDMEFGFYNRGMSYYMLRQYKAAAEDFASVRKQ